MSKKYIIEKVGIRSDSVFYSNEDFDGKVYDSLDKAVAESAIDVYNEIGWGMDDLIGRFEEVCGYLRSGQTYSFADIVWQIKEIDSWHIKEIEQAKSELPTDGNLEYSAEELFDYSVLSKDGVNSTEWIMDNDALEELISDYITDNTGFCHNGFRFRFSIVNW